MQISDADGHVNDRPCMDEISKYMPPGNRTQVFPAFDHIHFHFLEGGEKRSRTATVGPQEWVNFLDDRRISNRDCPGNCTLLRGNGYFFTALKKPVGINPMWKIVFWQSFCHYYISIRKLKSALMKLTVAVNVLMILLYYAILLLVFYSR